MIQSIFNIIIFMVMKLVEIVLYPIDLLIAQTLPELGNALQSLSDLLNYASTYLHWIFDALMLSSFALGLLSTYYIFKLTVPLNVWAIKLGIKWYRAIKG